MGIGRADETGSAGPRERGDVSLRRRRFAVLVVFVVASTAVIATTPAIATSTLVNSDSTSAEVTPDRPAVRGHFSIDVSAAALPTAYGVNTSGNVDIRVEPADAVVTLVPRAGAPSALVRAGSAGVDLGAACTLGRHCSLTYDLLVEPPPRSLSPTPAVTGPVGPTTMTGNRVSVSVSASLQYSGRDLVPPDATVAITGLESLAPISPASGLDAAMGEDEVVVGPSHPIAVRELELELSAAAIPRPIVAPLSGTLDVAVEELDHVVGSSDRVSVEIVPEETLSDPPITLPRAAALPVEPFTSCPPNEACRRRILLVFDWQSQDPTRELRASWKATAHVRYDDMNAVGPDATLTIRTVESRAAGEGGASVSAQTSLTTSGTTSKYGSPARAGFALTADARTLDATDLRGIPPPSVGFVDVAVHTADGRPLRGDPTVEVNLSGPNGTIANGYPLYARPTVNGAVVRMAFQPLRICESGQPCRVAFAVGMSVPGENVMPPGIPLVAEFHVSTKLLYLSLATPPAGAALQLDAAPLP